MFLRKIKKLYKNISVLLILSSSQLLFQSAARADRCHDKFSAWYQEPDRQRCRAEEQGSYETNKFDLKAEVDGGGWTTSWADDISETDAAQGVVAGGVSIYTANSGPFIVWVEQLVQRTVNSISADLTGNALQEAEKLARQVIYDAVSGKSSREITKQFDTVDFKAGAIQYSGRNLLGGQTVSTTWGLKPYVAFRVRPSSPPAPSGSNVRLEGSNIYQGNTLIDNNPKTIQVIEGSNGVFQLHNDGQIWQWLGKPCDGNSCPHWVMIDNNPATKKITTVGDLGLFQLHNNGKIWQWKGQPCNGGSCPHWVMLDNNSSTVDIFSDGSKLLQRHNSGQQWEWLGEPCSDWCHSWQTI